MRYGKVQQNDWILEFRFNWKESKYDVFASKEDEPKKDKPISIGLVWKNLKKSRRKPCWEAFSQNGNGIEVLSQEFPQMRLAGLALLESYLD